MFPYALSHFKTSAGRWKTQKAVHIVAFLTCTERPKKGFVHPVRRIWNIPTLQRHNTEYSKQIFPGKELRGYSPNSYIHVHVSDLYVYSSDPLPILLQENRWAERGNI